jgi:His-Xaa-Ser system radical SAM maturase HxsC
MGALMLALSVADNAPLSGPPIEKTLILRVTRNANLAVPLRTQFALVLVAMPVSSPDGFGAILIFAAPEKYPDGQIPVIRISRQLEYLDDGDVIKITPRYQIRAMFRKNARTNSLLVTERCNSFCVMCSQPPRDIDDSYIVDDLMRAIPLFDRSAREIGITGGEPTLIGEKLFALVERLKCYLPETGVHILSNGRNFKNLELAQAMARLHHPDLMIGIPLYSDVASIHDFVVQADNAFDETIAGILNLKRCGVRVEIRVVIHRETYKRLPALARFIARNLLFVDHVALMGLELMGFAKSNLDAIWIDPVEYQPELREAVEWLTSNRMRVSIYNHQLCLLDPTIRRFAVKSISDWKNEYMPECDGCELKDDCGGFFSSAKLRYSPNIRAHRAAALAASA